MIRQLSGPECFALLDADAAFHQREYERLLGALEDTAHRGALPASPTARPVLHDLLVRLRLQTVVYNREGTGGSVVEETSWNAQ